MKKIEISFEELFAKAAQAREKVWSSLWNGRSIERIAVSIEPGPERRRKAREKYQFHLNGNAPKPEAWSRQWDENLENQLYDIAARLELPGDAFVSLEVPRFVHGQSQGICDIFGAEVEEQADGLYHVHPLDPIPEAGNALEPSAVQKSMYWGAVEWLEYVRGISGCKQIHVRNPVMTGPLDTASYLLGTTTLMEWIYTEPETLHNLLGKITGIIIYMQKALKTAAGHAVCGPAHFKCSCGGFDFCSEIRSMISRENYENFEAQYLRKIGAATGSYGIHSCGSWERTVAGALSDPNLRGMNGQVRENDLAELFRQGQGEILFSIGPSVDLDERYTWPDTESFLEYICEHYSENDLLEIAVSESDMDMFRKLNRKFFGHDGKLLEAVL
jgi:hypothetical protein